MKINTMAKVYDVSQQFIREAIAAADLKAINISSNPDKPRYLIRVTDADAWLDYLEHRSERNNQ